MAKPPSKSTSSGTLPAPEEEKTSARGASAAFGQQGTNKTVPVPQPDAEPSDELQGTKNKYIPETPYTRG
ncbi:MAG: hypothetical protein HYX42_14220 [Polaromonas sp.]|uniref:hypothetical protein n=1 Tax=Polaromonas sp. TaxID=1869339 RepID=UPI0025F7DFC9|nr:hypothetical protein [Polaromonas sp.]MBI2727394.1 hypothetical protein [Polaromonas sp.]